MVRLVDRREPGQAGVLLFIAVITLFRWAYSGWFELSLDEGYYWVWSLHPSLSYYDHPPMTAWIIALFGLLGETERHIRAGAVVCGAISSYFVYLTAREVFGAPRAAFWAVAALNLTPMFALGSVVMTPDSPLFMFWGMAAYSGVRLVNTQQPHYWYALGLFFGLAMLSKYTAALLAPAILLFLLVSEENRIWLFRREPYLAFILSALIFLPVIVWNADRDWISFRFQLSHGFSGDQPGVLASMGEFWGAQAGMTGGLLFFFLMAAPLAVAVWGAREKRDDYLYLGVIGLGLTAFFLLNSMRTRMEGNWSAPMYFTAVAAVPFFANAISRGGGVGGAITGTGYKLALWLAGLLILYAHIQIVEPALPMPQKYEISRRIYGWRILAGEADLRLAKLGRKAFIVTDRYQISTLLTYYTRGHREAYITNGAGRFGYLGSVAHLPGANALYLAETSRSEIGKIAGHFKRVEKSGSLRIERRGELIREFVFYKCYNYQGGLIQI